MRINGGFHAGLHGMFNNVRNGPVYHGVRQVPQLSVTVGSGGNNPGIYASLYGLIRFTRIDQSLTRVQRCTAVSSLTVADRSLPV